LGLGMQTTVIHTEAQMQKEQAFKLWLTQEHDGAKDLADQARHSQVAVGTIEPPRLVHRTPVVALAGETRSGSGVLG
jgi:hypothetical protein